MLRLLPPLTALLASATVILPVPVAAANGGYYQAVFATPVGHERMVAKELLWSCDGATCVAAAASNSRPAIVCGALAKAAGPLSAFSAGGAAFAAAALEKCNGRAS